MAPKEHKEQIVSFSHSDDAWRVTTTSDPDDTFNYGYIGDADLGEFLARPTKIAEQDWTVAAGSFIQTIDPWTLFVEDARVRNRIEGYKLLRGKLHLRVAVNGNPFLFGRAICSYKALASEDQFAGPNGADLITMQQSMLPHVYIDPTSSQGGEIVCPFLCADNWLDLCANGSVARMGTLTLRSFNDLLHANSATGSCKITVFAWMEDVKLAAPTAGTYATYTAQGGQNDEYGQGIISKPASTLAKVAGYLTEIPVIGSYAKATEFAATAVGSFASYFGFARPTIITDIVRHKPTAVGNLVNTDAHDTSVKLSLDSKQELTVDPRTVGLSDVDEMALSYIAQKEAFLGTVTWSAAQADGTVLREIAVNPMQHTTTLSSFFELQLSPMATVSVPFRFWRGSIVYRFQVAASQMHRGRLRISYDPCGVAGPNAYNENYTRTIDLATNRDFEFEVGWNSISSWLRVDEQILSDSGNVLHNNPTYDSIRHNGIITLSVLNELTSPDPSLGQNVYINYYVRAGPDFEVAGPDDQLLDFIHYGSQMGFTSQGGGDQDNVELVEEADDRPESSDNKLDAIDTKMMMKDNTNHVYFGESISSIRSLLKRFMFHSALAQVDGPFWWVEQDFPYYPGDCGDEARHVDNSGTPVDFNFSAMTHLNWFTPCFAARRGGLRNKYVNMDNKGHISIRRSGYQQYQGPTLLTTEPANESVLAYEYRQLYKGGISGIHAIKGEVDGAMEFESPFYYHRRFAHARSIGAFSAAFTYRREEWGSHVGVCSRANSTRNGMVRYVAAADDYSLFHWQGQPMCRIRSNASQTTAESFPIQ